MHSTLTASEADPRDVFMIESLLAGGAKPPAAEPAPSVSPASAPPVNIAPDFSAIPGPAVDATIRAAADDVRIGDIRVDDIKPLNDEPAPKWVKRVVMSVLALCGAVTAAAWQHHGDTAKQVIADLTPSIVSASSELTSAVLGSSSPAQTAVAVEQPASPAIQAATADPAAAPAPPAQPSQATAPAVNPSSPESVPSMQSMARDLAAMGQEIEQLKASIEQMKTAQAQMAAAKTSVPKTTEAAIAAPAPRAKMPPPVRAAAAPAHRPKPAYSAAYSPPPVAAAPPPAVAPVPPMPERAQATATDGEPVVRPPMPVTRWGD